MPADFVALGQPLHKWHESHFAEQHQPHRAPADKLHQLIECARFNDLSIIDEGNAEPIRRLVFLYVLGNQFRQQLSVCIARCCDSIALRYRCKNLPAGVDNRPTDAGCFGTRFQARGQSPIQNALARIVRASHQQHPS